VEDIRMPQTSVVVPTHDRSRLLALTLRSVLWQREVDLEVVVVDDGSADDTAEVVAGLADPRVRLVRHATPQGVSAARNRGAAEARGAWVAFLDDDDLWAPDKLARQLDAARATGRAWAYAGAVKIDDRQRIVGGTPPPSPEQVVARLPRWNPMPGGCSNVVVTGSAFAAAGPFDRRLVNLADWDLWIRLARAGPPACNADPLVGYRIHAGNASRDVALILSEVELVALGGAAEVDRGALHHYLAWVSLRSGRRRAALRHFARAAARGAAVPVARDLSSILGHRLARHLPSRPARERPDADRAWRSQAERWLAELQ
jgi:glycosyltransferase involved in cell wall biosynthesis